MARSAIMSVRITGNSDDAVKALSKVTAKASAFGAFAGGMAVKGVTALWDTIKGFSGAVMDMSDSTDKFKNTMNFAGLDSGAVEAVTKAARKYADETVYDLSTIQNTTAQLAANGIGDYTGLTQAAGNLNAVAGGNADTFKSVAMVLTQTAGAGKLTTENWNQLADAIPGASGKLQEAMLANEAYTGNFRDAMADGEITADEFNQAIMQLGMSDVAQEAATSTQTMEGALGNLEASITGGLTDAFNLFKPTVTDAIGTASEQISSFASTGIENLKSFMTGLKDTGGVQAFGDALGKIWDAAGRVGSAFVSIVEDLTGLNAALPSANTMGDTLGDVFSTAAGFVSAAAGKLTEFSDWVNQNAEPITTALVAIGGGLAAFKIAGAVTSAANALGLLVGGIKAAMAAQGASAAIQAFSSAVSGSTLLTKAAAAAQWLLNAALNANPIMIVVTAIGALVAALVWFFTQTETGKQIWSSFTSWLGSCVQSIIGFFQALPGRISAFFSNAANAATNTWNSVVNWFRGLPGRIMSAVGDVGGTLVNAGASIINGFLSGLKSAWDNVTGFVGGIADWIAEHKGPISYDRRLLVPAGTAIMKGLATGITTGFDTDVRRAVGKINASMGGIVLSHPAAARQGSTSITYNINVRGVLDGNDAARTIRRILAEYDRKRGN